MGLTNKLINDVREGVNLIFPVINVVCPRYEYVHTDTEDRHHIFFLRAFEVITFDEN